MILIVALLLMAPADVLSCVTSDAVCLELYNRSNSSSDLHDQCRWKSEGLACYSGDLYNCPDPTSFLQSVYADYYSLCSLSADDVNLCRQKTSACRAFLKAATEPLMSRNYTDYCRIMHKYDSCLEERMTSCSENVTTYDVSGHNLTTYGICTEGISPRWKCDLKLHTCHATVMNVLVLLREPFPDVIKLCQALGTYRECLDAVHATCDPGLDPPTLPPNVEPFHDHFCLGQPPPGTPATEACIIRMYPCRMITANMRRGPNTYQSRCSYMQRAMACVEERIALCDPSVDRRVVGGVFERNYREQCSAGGLGHCPEAGVCRDDLVEDLVYIRGGITDMKNINILDSCRSYTTFLGCLDNEFRRCNLTSRRSYDFRALQAEPSSSCAVLVAKGNLLRCGNMTTCMSTLSLPTSIMAVSDRIYDPQYWCSITRSTLFCASENPGCTDNNTRIDAALESVVNLCPDSTVAIRPDWRSLVNSGHVISAAGFSYLCLFVTVFARSLELHFEL